MAEAKKKSSKMTWNRLKNDASIQKNELVRIAKAFGITPPKGWKDTKTREKGGPTGRERSRTVGGYKAPARKKAADKEPAAIYATRQKAVAPKAKKRAPVSAAADPSPKATRAASKAKSPTTRTRTSERVYKTTSTRPTGSRQKSSPKAIGSTWKPGRVVKRELISGGSLLDVPTRKPRGRKRYSSPKAKR
jgi:hypothetical protein